MGEILLRNVKCTTACEGIYFISLSASAENFTMTAGHYFTSTMSIFHFLLLLHRLYVIIRIVGDNMIMIVVIIFATLFVSRVISGYDNRYNDRKYFVLKKFYNKVIMVLCFSKTIKRK